jgi:hypothetical protein
LNEERVGDDEDKKERKEGYRVVQVALYFLVHSTLMTI